MTKEELREYLDNAIDKKTAKLLAMKALKDNAIKDLVELSFFKVSEVAFRAAWVLEYCLITDRKCMVQHLDNFLAAYVLQKNKSCQRHYTKIMMHLSEKGQVHLLQQYDLSLVIETSFEWLINPETPVAVQVNCMDILFNLRDRCDWIEEELGSQINFLLKSGSAAMQSRGRKILKRLK